MGIVLKLHAGKTLYPFFGVISDLVGPDSLEIRKMPRLSQKADSLPCRVAPPMCTKMSLSMRRRRLGALQRSYALIGRGAPSNWTGCRSFVRDISPPNDASLRAMAAASRQHQGFANHGPRINVALFGAGSISPSNHNYPVIRSGLFAPKGHHFA